MTTLVCCIATLFFGFFLGFIIRTRRIEQKKQEVLDLMKEVRNKNNEMLMNFSKMAHAATQTDGQWTEIDDFLMPMWME